MANIEKGFCPTCKKNRKLSHFRYGVIRVTLCTFCLESYLRTTLNPFELEELRKSAEFSEDNNFVSEVLSDDSTN